MRKRFHSDNVSNAFRPRYAGGIQKSSKSPAILDLSLRNLDQGCDAIVFEKVHFQNVSSLR